MPLLLDSKYVVTPVGFRMVDGPKGLLMVRYCRDGETIVEEVEISRLSGEAKFELEGRTYGLKVKE